MFERKIKLYCQNINIQGLIIFFIHFFISCYTDTNIFQGEYTQKKLYWIIKLIAVITMFFFWQSVCKIYIKLKNKDYNTQLFIKNFCIYFIPMIIFLILTWPGIWRCDEFNVLDIVCNMKLMYWQHWLTDAYYIFCLCIIGFPVGIVIIQILIISLIVSFIVTNVHNNLSSDYAWILYVPLFFPTVISNNLYPLRLPLYSFIELLFLFLIINYYICRKAIKVRESLILGTLIPILAAWRSEAIFYLILAPIAIFTILKKQIKLQWFSIILVLSISLYSGINYVQNRSGYSVSYSLSAISYQLGEILKTDFKSNSKEKDLEIINKVFPVDEYLKSGNTGGGFIIAYVLNNNSESVDKDFKYNVEQLKKVYVKLVIYNFPEYVKSSAKAFLITSGFSKDYNSSVADSSSAFDDGYIYTVNTIKQNSNNSYYISMPINNGLRTWVIRLLECRYANNYYKTNFLFHFFYNVVPSIIAILIIFVIGLLRKNKLVGFLGLLILIRPGLIFATAPALFFMYYLPTYICGHIIALIFLIARRKILIT